MNKLKPMMLVGTGSDVGKSIVTTAFCRIFKEDGYSPAPFKAQNMSLNSYATKDNFEIGRAQAVQAEACGIDCTTDMNPVLLKPNNNLTSQLVLHGKPAGNKTAAEYFMKDNKKELFKEVQQAFDRLNSTYSPVVMEGAGSISEMNLWEKDIVNMRMAQYANAATFLVADIDKGGLFASVYGSIALLSEEQRSLIQGIIVNKFRGDISLFESGKKIIEDLTQKPVVGILPYFTDIFIEQEDSVALEKSLKQSAKENAINIGVILLKSISNFTDFNMLEMIDNVNVVYIQNQKDIESMDILIIPGSKNTIADLKNIRESGLAKAILQHHSRGKALYGICGGYQMMGEIVRDPKHIEGNIDSMPGLGILPIQSIIEEGKTTRQCSFSMIEQKSIGKGYEIHAGISYTSGSNNSPLCKLDNGSYDGYYLNNRCWGSYIHGILDNKSVIESILNACEKKNESINVQDYESMKEENYTLLARKVRECVDMDYIYSCLEE